MAQGEVLKVTNQKKEQPKLEGGKPDLEACCEEAANLSKLRSVHWSQGKGY